MALPKRASTYILGLLLVVLAILVVWLFKALNAPELQQALARKQQQQVLEQIGEPLNARLSAYDAGRPAGVFYGSAPVPKPLIDEANLAKANQLNAPESNPAQDLQIVGDFLELYRKAFGSNPTGLNEDIVAAMTGTADANQPGRVFPPNSNAIRNGQLVDRWGTPFWFHPVTGAQMEIRSAGPDKELFTPDDVVSGP